MTVSNLEAVNDPTVTRVDDSPRIAPSGLLHQLRMFRGWLAWHFVMKWPGDPLRLGALLGWAGYYAYDDSHSQGPSS